ncbi:hypothetical protein [Nitrospira moscoviensis]|uniref:Uncharacterized protein n=1 Tax=Nitrospira moscoviensis TaxID=42253 RepID=A0A0K2G7F9_NITMO|nr:hypothetical protein [Nitrospira moscoviensis]ALA56870.1 conserved membrane protein of unknown function [Nitrospira moscoviensis]
MPSVVSGTVVSLILVIAGAVWALLMVSARRAALDSGTRRRFGLASGAYLVGWLVLAFVLGSNGIVQAAPSRAFPGLVFGIALLVITGAWLLNRSSVLKTVVASIPLPWLIGVQCYRVVGLIFLVLYSLDRMPGEFAIPAGWGDVAVGLTAPAIGYALYKGYRWSCLAAAGWNIFGLIDLIVAVTAGFLSSPGPFQTLALENPNVLITGFPLAAVPLYAVPLSILLHLAALKRLKLAARLSLDPAAKGTTLGRLAPQSCSLESSFARQQSCG